MSSYENYLLIGVLVPFISFWVLMLFGPRLGKPLAGWVTVAAMGISCILATVTLVPYPNQYGIVRADADSYVTSFAEKPELDLWINAGIYLFTREIDDLLPDVGDHETETFPQLAEAKRMAAYKSSAFWTSIESQKELREAGEHIK